MRRLIGFALAFALAVDITPVVHGAEPTHKLAALTFDDGPHAVYTAQLLDGLKERGVPATFFFLGQCAEENQELVRRAYEEGHEVACHTWSHPDLTKLSDEKIKSQIDRCSDLFDGILGEQSSYLVRPPYGSTDRRVRAAVDRVMLFWSVDTLDWKLKDEEKVYRNIISEVRDGSVILCHDIHKTTIPAALRAVDTLRTQGYEFVTVSELFRRRGVEPQRGKLYSECAPGPADPGPLQEPVISFGTAAEGRAVVTIDAQMPVYYTTDGTYPDGRSTRYTGPFTVEDGTEIRAVAAWKLNGSRSAMSTAKWEQPAAVQVAAPIHDPVPPRENHRDAAAQRELSGLHLALVVLGLSLVVLDVRHRQAKARRKRRRRPHFNCDADV